ncbi:MAG: zinc ribbon domain-containing protein [Bacteroidaceae bacterium]|nr:zinc ribbon domain-containing protein [Bacteroidaceae bacterium]
MKKCPHCGADLTDGTASFCPVCGKETEILENKKSAKKKGKKKSKSKNMKGKKVETISEVMGEAVDDGYDGYYNDVLPPDQDRISEGLDKELLEPGRNSQFGLN